MALLCPEGVTRTIETGSLAMERHDEGCGGDWLYVGLYVGLNVAEGASPVWSQRTLILAADGSTGGPWKHPRKTRRRISIGGSSARCQRPRAADMGSANSEESSRKWDAQTQLVGGIASRSDARAYDCPKAPCLCPMRTSRDAWT